MRFWFDDDDAARRDRLARTATAFVLVTTTSRVARRGRPGRAAVRAAAGHERRHAAGLAVLGLWAFTNLEIAYALLRVDERRRAYLAASLANVLLTVALTVTLVVVLD